MGNSVFAVSNLYKRSRKKKKCKNGNKIREDRISHLPDGILQQIISLLSMKPAVCTSVLSKRWRYLWTSISTLNIIDQPDKCNVQDRIDKMRFRNFVEMVLLLHNPTFKHKVCLFLWMRPHGSRVNKWISTILNRKPAELLLDIDHGEHPLVLPCSIFTCESLTILTLDVDSVLTIPSSICFPFVKVMNLTNVKISCDQEIPKVSLTCPNLEELHLTDCLSKWDVDAINIVSPKLKLLEIWDIEDAYEHVYDREIKFFAESLLSLDITSNLPYNLSLHNISSLSEASINVYSEYDIGHHLEKFIEGIYTVKDLKLSIAALDVFIHICGREDHGWKFQTILQPFLSNLKAIEFRIFYGTDVELCLVAFLLKNARVLVKMTFISSSTLVAKKQMEIQRRLLMHPRGSTCSVIHYS
ncbi:hypothetical protein AQUCO_04700107v1 [Aquilegia coerulea]|uniref:FBD domain-containing protein n=1 Tax=Aquilegia coerulea TaxID=218851 RepID=A0A2G5CL61_AQUCA|nr:hypothetical protein AQUCO_04700107v1 [Aquilegia coerulea]